MKSFALLVWLTAPLALGTAADSSIIERNGEIIQKFPAPDGKLTIETRSRVDRDNASLRLIRGKNARPISMIQFAKQARALQALWSPNTKFVAIAMKIGDSNRDMVRFYAVLANRLVELKYPDRLHIVDLLPASDRARTFPITFESIEVSRWIDNDSLRCTVSGSARLFETAVVKSGYLTIAYDVTIRCDHAAHNARIIKAKQTQYEKSEEEQAEDVTPGGPDEAFAKHLQNAAAEGDPIAQVNLGWLYEEGTGVPKDYNKAVELYRKAANQNYAPGQAYLGSAYAAGHGVRRDYNKAVELLEKATKQNDVNAFNDLAWFLATCPDASRRNGARAVDCARNACNLTVWKERNFVETLAAAYAETGDFERAVMYQKNAMELPGDYPDDAEMSKALHLYQDRKPYRTAD